MNWKNCVSVMLVILAAVGCASTKVVKGPDANDKGIRYYRPKPYLMVKPANVEHGKIDISLVYLPDYTEEYSIHICAGIGSNATSVKLEDGWNLTGIDVTVDNQLDELLGAAAQVISAVPKAGDVARTPTHLATCSGRAVPLGLYEAVTGVDHCCEKRIYGWRYIGFMPFAGCPVNGGGGPYTCLCDDGSLDVWGLVWDGDALCFKRIADIASEPLCKDQANERADAVPTPAN
jgi:hypothetical protein